MPETHAAVDLRSATSTKQLVLKRTIKASPERIFDAFTDPDQLKKWWWPNGFTCPAAEVDLRVGGTYRLAMEWPGSIPTDQQFSHQMGGEYYEIERPHRLAMEPPRSPSANPTSSRCLPLRRWTVPSRVGRSSSTSSSGFSRAERESLA